MTPEEKAVIQAAIAAHDIGRLPSTAQETILRQTVHALIFSCPECNQGGHTCPGDGEPIGHGENNCGQHDQPDPVWMPAMLRDCLTGDRMRIGSEETDVLHSSIDDWHATADQWRPAPWDHEELILDLSANPGRQQYPADLACEILCSPERAATLLLQQSFPGTKPVDK